MRENRNSRLPKHMLGSERMSSNSAISYSHFTDQLTFEIWRKFLEVSNSSWYAWFNLSESIERLENRIHPIGVHRSFTCLVHVHYFSNVFSLNVLGGVKLINSANLMKFGERIDFPNLSGNFLEIYSKSRDDSSSQ